MRSWKLADISSADDWVSTATADGPNVKSFLVGPQLPVNDSGVVQASGGHSSTVFYFSDPVHFDFDEVNNAGGMRLWKWTPALPEWVLIVPPQVRAHPIGIGTGGASAINRGPQKARRFYVDPYRPNLIYVLADDHVYRSDDGGAGWTVDTALETQLTQSGAFSCVVSQDDNPAEALLRDMQFDPLRPGTSSPRDPLVLRPSTEKPGLRSSSRGNRFTPDRLRTTWSVGASTSRQQRNFEAGSISAGLGLPGQPAGDDGLITLLRVHEVGTGARTSRRPSRQAIVGLDSEPESLRFPVAHRRQPVGPQASSRSFATRSTPIGASRNSSEQAAAPRQSKMSGNTRKSVRRACQQERNSQLVARP